MRSKYTCTLGSLTLCVKSTADQHTLDVRVTKKRGSVFQHALNIRPGTVLHLVARKRTTYVRVRVFLPRVRYGRLVAGGVVCVEP